MALIELRLERQSFLSELAEEVWHAHSGERQVFLDGIAESEGVTLSWGDYGDAFDGLLEHKSAAFHIYCNTARGQPYNSPRARFTIAHELGHFFIDEQCLVRRNFEGRRERRDIYGISYSPSKPRCARDVGTVFYSDKAELGCWCRPETKPE